MLAYPERWRDWPYETQQPAFSFECSGVNSCRSKILKDKKETSYIVYWAAFLLESSFLFSYLAEIKRGSENIDNYRIDGKWYCR
jgi:hypothetical protein